MSFPISRIELSRGLLFLLLVLNLGRWVLRGLLNGDEPQSVKDAQDRLILIQGVHVKPWRSRLDESFAHLRSKVNAIGLHGLCIVLNRLESVKDLLGHLRLAEASHAHESAVGLDGHDTGEDWAVDADVPAVLDKLKEVSHVVKELGDDHLATGIDLLLQKH